MSTATLPANDCLAGRTEHEQEIVRQLHRDIFADVPDSELACLVAVATEDHHQVGEVLAEENTQLREFHVLLEGLVEVVKRVPGGQDIFRKTVVAPAFMGEVTLLAGGPNLMSVTTLAAVWSIRVSEESFWQVLATCPTLRRAILQEFGERMQGLAAMRSQQERLISLGMMTAGLMHELNNPGAAAQRAASQLRDNLNRMHLLARGFSERGHSTEQRECLTSLQERVLKGAAVCMDSLQQSDREEEMGEWLDTHHVEDAWTIAPTLVAGGVAPGELNCLAGVFPGHEIEAPVGWLAATASSMQQVSLVEESVSRVHELAKAVKRYVHEGQGGQQSVSVNESIHATLVLLKHKFREKQIALRKEFGANLPAIQCVCSGLNQVWTNLLDNAIDAVPDQGHITVRTWQEAGDVLVGIGDDGPGIGTSEQTHIFEPFYTTKPAGVGTGMGLGIVKRIVENYHGTISLRSEPGATEFVIRIPAADPANAPAATLTRATP